MSKSYKRVRGFQFAGVHCGIKENPSRLDLALIYSEAPCQVAGSFTTNRAKAAPVVLDLQKMKRAIARAVVVNSGNANACTGPQGLKRAAFMVEETAKVLKLDPQDVWVSSTGKIGVPLPLPKVKEGIRSAASLLSEKGLPRAARAILTTDFFPKVQGVKRSEGSLHYTLAAFAKGAGMIEPAMVGKHATMLAYFMTDLNAPAKVLQPIFNRVVEATFNRVTVDGDMSTNDTALLLANGLAGGPPLKSGSKQAKLFEKDLTEVAEKLALQMVQDGEGATKVVELVIRGVRTEEEAREIAYRVGRSQLVKTSFYGQDPNWGRLLAAVGYSGIAFEPAKVDIYYGPVKVAAGGIATTKEADRKAHRVMRKKRFTVTLDLKMGRAQFRIWTSDLTTDYVKLNAEYRT